MKKNFPSKRKIPLKYFFSIETLKNNNFLKKCYNSVSRNILSFFNFSFVFFEIMTYKSDHFVDSTKIH